MAEVQRERHLTRAGNLERHSHEERARVKESYRRYSTLPPDRQAAMRSAFRDLHAIPPDQREGVLGSVRCNARAAGGRSRENSLNLQKSPRIPFDFLN